MESVIGMVKGLDKKVWKVEELDKEGKVWINPLSSLMSSSMGDV